MAISYKDLVKKLETDPLSREELDLIKEAEEFIDSEILKKFGDNHFRDVYIDLPIIHFEYSMKAKKHISGIKYPRKGLMAKELLKRYSDMGWAFEYSDDIDNPYVRFKGKK
jgi:hypothetical protein